ncbi:MAG: hypothetical protein RRY12_01675 [Cloacibacillus sp.]
MVDFKAICGFNGNKVVDFKVTCDCCGREIVPESEPEKEAFEFARLGGFQDSAVMSGVSMQIYYPNVCRGRKLNFDLCVHCHEEFLKFCNDFFRNTQNIFLQGSE